MLQRTLLRRATTTQSVGGLTLPVMLDKLSTAEEGTREKEDWSMYFQHPKSMRTAVEAGGDKSSLARPAEDSIRISPWHHIPLQCVVGQGLADSTATEGSGEPLFHCVNEIPIGTRAKLEIATKVELNPIRQDRVKKTGALRYFTYGDIPFNYGCLPQTWEDPRVVDSHTQCKGDGDPVDVVELGTSKLHIGQVLPVRVLGVLAMIDEGETDWKIVVSRLGSDYKKLSDVPTSTLDGVRHWFRYYKTTDGKPENHFAFEAQFKDADFALEIIRETQQQWQNAFEASEFEAVGLKA